ACCVECRIESDCVPKTATPPVPCAPHPKFCCLRTVRQGPSADHQRRAGAHKYGRTCGLAGLKDRITGYRSARRNGNASGPLSIDLVPEDEGIVPRRDARHRETTVLRADRKEWMAEHADVCLHPRVLVAANRDHHFSFVESVVDRRSARCLLAIESTVGL